MDDQRGIVETEKSVDLNNDNLDNIKSSGSLAMADGQGVVQESVIVVILDEGEKTEDHDEGSKGVLEKNAMEEKEMKDEKSSSCVIDVKLDDENDGGSGGGELVCRICHLSSDQSPDRCTVMNRGGGTVKELSLVQLGCGCKDELGVAHSHCAETWFKLKGNRICEICGEAARNITGIIQEPRFMEWHERRSRSYASVESYAPERGGGWWRGQPCCNFLMACLIVAFVLPWFFRVNIF